MALNIVKEAAFQREEINEKQLIQHLLCGGSW
jgi:hypothetical protein